MAKPDISVPNTLASFPGYKRSSLGISPRTTHSSLQGYQYTGYSQGTITGRGGDTTGTCVAQLFAGYVCLTETK